MRSCQKNFLYFLASCSCNLFLLHTSIINCCINRKTEHVRSLPHRFSCPPFSFCLAKFCFVPFYIWNVVFGTYFYYLQLLNKYECRINKKTKHVRSMHDTQVFYIFLHFLFVLLNFVCPFSRNEYEWNVFLFLP